MLVLGGGTIGMLDALQLRHYRVDRLDVAEVHEGRRAAVAQHAGCATFYPRHNSALEHRIDYVIDAAGLTGTTG